MTINNAAGDAKLEPTVLDSVFEMWWPRLEEQVDEIVKSHGKAAKAERRSDRDILEEVLQLARISAERAHRPSRGSPRAIMELTENIGELMFFVGRERADLVMSIMERMDRCLRHICMEAGVPEIYERFHVRTHEMLALQQKREEAAEQSPSHVREARRGPRAGEA